MFLYCLLFLKLWLFIYFLRQSKSDSAPVRGNGYEPGSLKIRLRANAEMSYSVPVGLVVVVYVVGRSEKFLYRIIRF